MPTVGPDVPWTIRAQSVVKPGNDVYQTAGGDVTRANEDRWRVRADMDSALAAVSDGAGASGLFCGPWAETLLDALPDAPLSTLDQLDLWLGDLSDGFHRIHLDKLSAQPMHRTKFVREGSFATLSACWFDRCADGVGLHWLGYGDSMILVFERTDGAIRLTRSVPGGLDVLSHAPHLLNWKDSPIVQGMESGAQDLGAGSTVVLASDGVGQSLLVRFLASERGRDCALADSFAQLVEDGQGKLADLARRHVDGDPCDFDSQWNVLCDALESQADFGRWVKRQCDDGLMANDDSTLIMVDIDWEQPPEEGETDQGPAGESAT